MHLWKMLTYLAVLFLIPVVYALPATLTLSRGRRPGLKPMSISQAVGQLRSSGLNSMDLVRAARDLVAERMDYCRRNSFDPYGRAFDRGYGYCQQQAYAFKAVLNQLGFEAWVVHAFRNRFDDGEISSHAWVRVSVDHEIRDIDSISYDSETGRITFEPLSRVLYYTPLFRLFSGWGCAAVNAHRYYVTGRDQ